MLLDSLISVSRFVIIKIANKKKITVTMIETTATNNSKFFENILTINCIKKFDQV